MGSIVYTAMSGAQQSFLDQAVVANNLANASTTGYKAVEAAMRAVPVQGDGALHTRVSTVATTPGADMAHGTVNVTGRNLDVDPQGNAWIAVQDANGGEAYTQDGNIQVDNDGLLTIDGHAVIGQNGPITVPLDSRVTLRGDGTVNVLGPGEQPDGLTSVGQIKMVTPKPGQLTRATDGMFQSLGPNGQPVTLQQDPDARLRTGALEGSNVSVVGAMVSLIETSRQYEMQIKTIETAEQNAQQANQLLTLPS